MPKVFAIKIFPRVDRCLAAHLFKVASILFTALSTFSFLSVSRFCWKEMPLTLIFFTRFETIFSTTVVYIKGQLHDIIFI